MQFDEYTPPNSTFCPSVDRFCDTARDFRSRGLQSWNRCHDLPIVPSRNSWFMSLHVHQGSHSEHFRVFATCVNDISPRLRKLW